MIPQTIFKLHNLKMYPFDCQPRDHKDSSYEMRKFFHYFKEINKIVLLLISKSGWWSLEYADQKDGTA